MSNDQSLDSLSSSISTMEITLTRPQQYGKLALLPVELILQITGEPSSDKETLPAKELKNLALSCANLFYLIRPMYYLAENCSIFQSALKQADVDQMERCALFGAAPDTNWNLTNGCCCGAEKPHKHHRPIDGLLECVSVGSVSLDKCIDALRWLLNKGYDAKEQGDQDWYRANDDCEHMPMLLFNMLIPECSRDRIEGICQIIRILRSYGYHMPHDVSFDSFYRARHGLSTTDPNMIRKPMDVAMRSYCPPYLLELVLQEHRIRNLKIRVWSQDCPPEAESWVGSYLTGGPAFYRPEIWAQSSSLGALLWNLYSDLLDSSTDWIEKYPGEAADILENKIKLLVKHRAIDIFEEGALRKILGVLKDINMMAQSLGGLDEERDGKLCWRMLCESLRPLVDHHRLAAHTQHELDTERPRRLHRFVIEMLWNPWKVWHQAQLQKPQARVEMTRHWIDDRLFQKGDGTWTDLIWVKAEYYSVDPAYVEHHLPRWEGMSYDEFLAAVEELVETIGREDAEAEAREEACVAA
ncbi:hypothetical protein FSARC_4383 [Fusarium sarcochroum]|uniref:Uncharacterized protein n=1 Tax=Fusarium sarcochroum TaxID=1208366 RepID=A0A8H4XAN6_9HYPO|nr:hypothetical protein FSARC_4383 [Fusarium sarcochroum]